MAWSIDQQMQRNMEFFSPEAVAAREAGKQAGKERIEGTYAQRAADEQRLKGTFDQSARLQRELQGTFQQNANLRRESEGPFAERHAGARELADLRGAQELEQLGYHEGPGSIADRELILKGELGRGELSQGEKRLGLMGSELDVKKKALISEHLGKAREDALSLFPDDAAKADAYYKRESSRINKMFPELAPPPSGVGKWDDGGPGAGGGAVMKDVATDRAIMRSMPSAIRDPMSRASTLAVPAPKAFTPPPIGRTGDLFPTSNPKPPPRPLPKPLPPEADVFPGGGGMNRGAEMVSTPARRRPIPITGRVVQPVPSAMAGAAPSMVRKPLPTQGRDRELFKTTPF